MGKNHVWISIAKFAQLNSVRWVKKAGREIQETTASNWSSVSLWTRLSTMSGLSRRQGTQSCKSFRLNNRESLVFLKSRFGFLLFRINKHFFLPPNYKVWIYYSILIFNFSAFCVDIFSWHDGEEKNFSMDRKFKKSF